MERKESRSRYVVRLTNGIPGVQQATKSGETTALKVFKYEKPLDFIMDFSPTELDALFSFDSKYLLSARNIAHLSKETLMKISPQSHSAPAPKGSLSPRRSPTRTNATKANVKEPLVVLGVEVQIAETDIKTYISDPTLPSGKLMEIIGDLIRGVIDLHSNRRAHLDIKPANCLYANSKAMLSDFGSCAIISDSKALEFRRCPTTRIYAAPEAIGVGVIDGVAKAPLQGEGNKRLGRVGMTNDMWSLGATIFEILTLLEFYRFLPQAEMDKMLNYDDFGRRLSAGKCSSLD